MHYNAYIDAYACFDEDSPEAWEATNTLMCMGSY